MLILKYTGSRRVKVASPQLPPGCTFSELLAVTAASSTAVWAAGFTDCANVWASVVVRYQ